MPGRSNGLPAIRYSPLVDLEPQLADALLEALRDEGVAAYAAPSPGVKGPYQDVTLPDRPTDRVWVDEGARTRAREVLSARMPEFQDALSQEGMGEEHGHPALPGAKPATPPAAGAPNPADPKAPGTDDDAAWEAIIAGWDLTAEDPVPRWPVSEDVESRDVDTRRPDAPPPPAAKVIRPAQTEPAPLGPRAYEPPDETAATSRSDDADDHFVPPPPPPLPRIDPLTKLSWVGVLGAPIWLLLVNMFDWTPVEGSNVLVLAAFIGGFVGLIYRMKDDRDDDDHDDGAVV